MEKFTLMTNNKYIIKVLAPWMIDELLVISDHTEVDVILLQKQEDFYKQGLNKLNSKNIKIYKTPFSNRGILKKIFLVRI